MYGTRPIDDEEESDTYQQLISAYKNIPKLKKSSRNKALTEWLIKCTENIYTRHDGVYALWKMYHNKTAGDIPETRHQYTSLSTAHLHHLEQLFLSSDTLSTTELYIADLLSVFSPDIKRHLTKNLSYNNHLAASIMQKLLEKKPDGELANIRKEFLQLKDAQELSTEQHQLIEVFIRLANKS